MRALPFFVLAMLACSDSKPATELAQAPSPPKPGAITQLAAGALHTCALQDDGRVWCWGNNQQSQLGIEKLDHSVVPAAVPNVRGAVEISAADNTTCVRYADGAVDCWGHLGTASEVAKPARVTEDVAQIAGRCFRKKSGAVECLTEHAQLVPVEGITDAVDITATSGDRGCAIRANRTLACWLGTRPLPANALTGVQRAGLTLRGGCALLEHAVVKCWTVPDASNANATFTGARDLVTGGERICVRTETNIVCWADNNDRRKELGVAPNAALALSSHACVVRGGRDVACWGAGSEGQLGIGWSRRRVIPTRVPGLEDVVELGGAQRGTATCARTRDGKVSCWGNFPSAAHATPQRIFVFDVRELVGNSETLRLITKNNELHAVAYTYSAHPSELALTKQEDNVATASDHCHVTTTGLLRCKRTYVTPDPKDARYALVPKIEDAVEVASFIEGGTTCVRRRSGAVICFRPGMEGSESITAIPDATAIAVTDAAHCAIRADRSLWCWGSTQSPIFSPRPRPADVPPTQVPVGEVLAMSLARDGICVVRATGAVACWGTNSEGQLGDGTLLPRDRAADVIGISDAIDVHVGVGYACALHRTGHVSCWGTTDRGQVGTYVMSNVEEPASVIWP